MKSRGFTLVELLLAISLMSMLMALAYGGLHASTRAADRGRQILEESSRIRMAHQFVRKQLNQMIPLVFLEGDVPEERTVFEGSSEKIRFVGPMPGYLGFGGPQVQEFAFERSDDGLVLVVSHALLQGFEEANLYERAAIPLIGRIEHAQFQFLGVDEQGELAGWTSVWDQPSVLPLAVSLEIEFDEGTFTRWPLLTASVRVDAQALGDLAGQQGINRSYRAAISDMIQGRKDKK